MPSYLIDAEIDWRLAERPLADQLALLDLAGAFDAAGDHTIASMAKLLATTSRSVSGSVEAALCDEMLTDALVVAKRGKAETTTFDYVSPVDDRTLGENDARGRLHVPKEAFRELDAKLSACQFFLQNEHDVRIANGVVEIDFPFRHASKATVETAATAIAEARIAKQKVVTMVDIDGERHVVVFEGRRARVLPAAARPSAAHARLLEIRRNRGPDRLQVLDGSLPFALPASLAARVDAARKRGSSVSGWVLDVWSAHGERVAKATAEAIAEQTSPLATEPKTKLMAVLPPGTKLRIQHAAKEIGVKVSTMLAYAALLEGTTPKKTTTKKPARRR